MIQRYSIKTHPSGHVDMVPDEHGEWVRYAPRYQRWSLRAAPRRDDSVLYYAEPDNQGEYPCWQAVNDALFTMTLPVPVKGHPDRWANGTLLRAQEGEE